MNVEAFDEGRGGFAGANGGEFVDGVFDGLGHGLFGFHHGEFGVHG